MLFIRQNAGAGTSLALGLEAEHAAFDGTAKWARAMISCPYSNPC
jgi:hypothetical protein